MFVPVCLCVCVFVGPEQRTGTRDQRRVNKTPSSESHSSTAPTCCCAAPCHTFNWWFRRGSNNSGGRNELFLVYISLSLSLPGSLEFLLEIPFNSIPALFYFPFGCFTILHLLESSSLRWYMWNTFTFVAHSCLPFIKRSPSGFFPHNEQ